MYWAANTRVAQILNLDCGIPRWTVLVLQQEGWRLKIGENFVCGCICVYGHVYILCVLVCVYACPCVCACMCVSGGGAKMQKSGAKKSCRVFIPHSWVQTLVLPLPG